MRRGASISNCFTLCIDLFNWWTITWLSNNTSTLSGSHFTYHVCISLPSRNHLGSVQISTDTFETLKNNGQWIKHRSCLILQLVQPMLYPLFFKFSIVLAEIMPRGFHLVWYIEKMSSSHQLICLTMLTVPYLFHRDLLALFEYDTVLINIQFGTTIRCYTRHGL